MIATTCKKCGQPKCELGYCRPCKAKYARNWRAKNPERSRANERRSRTKNADKARARAKKWHVENRERHNAYCAKRRAENPRTVLSAKLKATFGITLEQYETILTKQENCCAVCGAHALGLKRKLAVDHDHLTKTVRGLLCHNCNVGLGNFKDDPLILTKAIKYLNEHSN